MFNSGQTYNTYTTTKSKPVHLSQYRKFPIVNRTILILLRPPLDLHQVGVGVVMGIVVILLECKTQFSTEMEVPVWFLPSLFVQNWVLTAM